MSKYLPDEEALLAEFPDLSRSAYAEFARGFRRLDLLHAIPAVATLTVVIAAMWPLVLGVSHISEHLARTWDLSLRARDDIEVIVLFLTLLFIGAVVGLSIALTCFRSRTRHRRAVRYLSREGSAMRDVLRAVIEMNRLYPEPVYIGVG